MNITEITTGKISLLFFILTFLSVNEAKSSKWVKGENGLVYHVSNKLLPWLDAREECEKRTGKLVSIGNEKSNDFVKSILKEQKPSLFWTGLSEDLYKKWSWEDGVGHLIYTNWAPGEPYDEDDVSGCAVIDGKGTWQVAHCETSRKFICQKADNGLDDDDDDDEPEHSSLTQNSFQNNSSLNLTTTAAKRTVAKEITGKPYNHLKAYTRNRRDIANIINTKQERHVPNKKRHVIVQKKASYRTNSNIKRSRVFSADGSRRMNSSKENNFQDEGLDQPNMALLRENLKEFSLIPDESPSTAALELSEIETGAKRDHVRTSNTPTKGKAQKKHGPGKASSGQCIFPFVYNGNTHFACIPSRKHEKRTWCALTNNYDRDLTWGFCVHGSGKTDKETKLKSVEERSNVSSALNQSKNVGIDALQVRRPQRQLKEIKTLIGSVLENEGVSHKDQKQILGDLEVNKNGTSTKEDSHVYNDIGTLEDEEEKLLAEEVQTHQFINDLGLNESTTNFLLKSRKNKTDMNEQDIDSNRSISDTENSGDRDKTTKEYESPDGELKYGELNPAINVTSSNTSARNTPSARRDSANDIPEGTIPDESSAVNKNELNIKTTATSKSTSPTPPGEATEEIVVLNKGNRVTDPVLIVKKEPKTLEIDQTKNPLNAQKTTGSSTQPASKNNNHAEPLQRTTQNSTTEKQQPALNKLMEYHILEYEKPEGADKLPMKSLLEKLPLFQKPLKNKVIEYHIVQYGDDGNLQYAPIKKPINPITSKQTTSPLKSPTSTSPITTATKNVNSLPTKEQKQNLLMYDFFKKYFPDLDKPIQTKSAKSQNPTGTSPTKSTAGTSEKPSHNANKVIFTHGGTGKGRMCEFPFIYGGNTYFDCTETNSPGRPWCSTSPKHSFDAHPMWGYCMGEDSNRPIDVTLSSMRLSDNEFQSTETTPTQIQSALKDAETSEKQEPPQLTTTEESTPAITPETTAEKTTEKEETPTIATIDETTQESQNSEPTTDTTAEKNTEKQETTAMTTVKQTETSTPDSTVETTSPNQNKPPTPKITTTTHAQMTPHVQRKEDLHTNGEELLSTDSGLRTYDGNGRGARCMIPFIYDGKTHSQCIMLNESESWCSTTHNYDKNMKWGKCCTPDKCGEDWAN